MAKPNLFIIGAAKSGTTSLHRYLGRHPEIFMSEPKEPGFFVPELTYYPRSEEWYLSLFDPARGERYRGEASTHYTKLPVHEGVPERIASFVEEEPRFIYVMRDPIDRMVSQYWHSIREFVEHRPLRQAVDEDITYRAFSDYELQLEPYFRRFGRDRVLTMTFERLITSPEETTNEIFDWLGLETVVFDGALGKHNEKPPEFKRVRGRGTLHRFSRSKLWDWISPFAPTWIKTLGRRLSTRPADPDPGAVDEFVEGIRAEMQAKVASLESFLRKDFPEWTVTSGVDRSSEQ